MSKTQQQAAELATFEQIDAAKQANRDAAGRIVNLALHTRLEARDRALVLSCLGWAPEENQREGRYVATTSELHELLRKKNSTL